MLNNINLKSKFAEVRNAIHAKKKLGFTVFDKDFKNQKGFSLLEIIIVLGIIGVITAGVVILAQRAFESRNVAKLVTNTNTLRLAMNDVYKGNEAYPDYKSPIGLTATTVTDPAANDIPTAQLVQLGKAKFDEVLNPFSGDPIAIGGAKSSATSPNTHFTVTLNGLTTEQCRAILSQSVENWDYAAVGGDAAGTYTAITTALPSGTATAPVVKTLGSSGGVPVSNILAVCNGTGTANSVILGSR